jgi:hypothetical protein
MDEGVAGVGGAEDLGREIGVELAWSVGVATEGHGLATIIDKLLINRSATAGEWFDVGAHAK